MRAHVNTHPHFDFPVGHTRTNGSRPKVKMCEDCRQRPARRNLSVCFGCAQIRNVLTGTLGRPFV